MNIKTFKTLYEKLPRDIFCKCLNQNIKITRTGYKHVFQEKIRKKEDITTRGKAIEFIPQIIQEINFYQFHTKVISITGNIDFWNLQMVTNGVCIHITLRRIGNQDIHLYSWHYRGVSPKIEN